MLTRSTPHLLAALLFGAAATASAQRPALPAAVDSGKLVRMHTATMTLEGRLLAPFRESDSTLRYCRFPGRPCLGAEDSALVRTMPTGELRRLEVSPGSQWRRGARIGGVFGVVAGAFTTAFAIGLCESPRCGDNRTALIALGGVVNGVAFGALGALWGSAFPRWESPR